MATLADQVDGVIGVDTHRDTLTAAAVTAVGGLLGELAVAADAAGYQRLLGFARAQVVGRRCFAVEGAGSYGAGLVRVLVERGEWVVEVDRPKRPARRAARAMRWTRSVRPGRRWPRRVWRRPVGGATGRPCGCCWQPVGVGDRPDLCPQPAQSADCGRP
jgi:transposase